MASNTRRQLENWLSKIDVTADSVIDIGGLFMPVKGRTKTWEVKEYRILDVKPTRNGIQTDYVADINYRVGLTDQYFNDVQFNVAFLLETLNHVWNPVQCFQNVHDLLKPGGVLYCSVHFVFPHHTGLDCLRYTSTGLQKILEETGFRVLEMVPKWAADADTLEELFNKESKVQYHRGEVGYMCKAQKI